MIADIQKAMGLFRISIPDFEQRAFREALVNAFSHRDYATLGRVRVQINDDGMMIANPGGFIEGIRADNLIDAEPHGRNPALADARKRIGRSLPIYSLLVMNSLSRFHKASVQDIACDVNTDESRTRVTLEMLTESGLVEAGGTGRGRFYTLGPKYYKNKKDRISYTRQKDIDAIRYDEFIMQSAKRQGYVRRSDVVALLHVTPPQAYRILAKLAHAEKRISTGKGAGSKYVPK